MGILYCRFIDFLRILGESQVIPMFLSSLSTRQAPYVSKENARKSFPDILSVSNAFYILTCPYTLVSRTSRTLPLDLQGFSADC